MSGEVEDTPSGDANGARGEAESVGPTDGARESEHAPIRTRIEVPGHFFVQVVLTVLITVGLLRFFVQVLSICILVGLALILAAVLAPVVAWLQRHRVGRGLASLIAIGLVVLLVLAVLGMVVPPLVIEGIEFANNLPGLIDHWQNVLQRYPDVFQSLERLANKLREDPGAIFTGFLRFGVGAATALFSAVLVLTLTLYFLMDQERIRDAILRQVPQKYRARADETLSAVAVVVRAYFTGQAIVSAIYSIFTFLLLTVLGVPYAAILAAIAFFLDAIPNIGSLIATVLPSLIALTQSLTTAIIVAAALILYNQVENNLISPRILGDRLKVPPVLTMIAILVGGALFGILGIILAIPLAGAIPVIERIWLRERLVVPAGD